MNKNKRKSNIFKSRPLIFTCVIAALIIGTSLAYHFHLFHHTPAATSIVKKVGVPNTNPTPNVSGSSSATAKTPNTSTVTPTGGSQDTNGTAITTTSPNQWITSQSGNITLKQPVANATLHDGDIISGSAKVNKVNFRLIDNKTGVIAQGTLNII